MRVAGIIAEYDPFHAGHAWQIGQLRQQGFDRIVICMSSWAVQRGGIPILPPLVRAQAALEAGADLVIALPAPYACRSAEGFAAAGVGLLNGLGCVDTLAFGAETADKDALLDTARLLLGQPYAAALRQQLAGGTPYAAARAAAAESIRPGAGALLAGPNNNLGVEYCKAILAQRAALTPLPVPRRGAAHGQEGETGGFASASWIRRRIALRGIEGARGLVPPAAFALYEQAAAAGLLTSARAFDLALLSRLRALTPEQLARIRGVNEGLQHRLADAVRTAPDRPGAVRHGQDPPLCPRPAAPPGAGRGAGLPGGRAARSAALSARAGCPPAGPGTVRRRTAALRCVPGPADAAKRGLRGRGKGRVCRGGFCFPLPCTARRDGAGPDPETGDPVKAGQSFSSERRIREQDVNFAPKFAFLSLNRFLNIE